MKRDGPSLPSRLAYAGLDWIVPAWSASPNVGALFTTRNGRAGAPFDVGPAQLGALDTDSQSRVLAGRALAHAFLPSAPVYLAQVHGAGVATVEAAPSASDCPVADAAVTRSAGVVLAVRVADCLPVLLADDRGTVVAAVHAGWRGLAAGVLEATVRAMDVPPESLRAWIGPGIGPRAFEVGDDVRDAILGHDPGAHAHFLPHAEHKWLADLPALAGRRLAAAGVPSVEACGLCTFADPSRFHSYRRDRADGRMAAYVWRGAPSL